MKLFLVALLALATSPCVLGKDLKFSVRLVTLLEPKDSSEITYSEGKISVERQGGIIEVFVLAPADAELVEEAVRQAPLIHWKGFWQTHSLDGEVVTGTIKIGGSSHQFHGLNGCPPGFFAIADTLNRVTKKKLFNANWKQLESESIYSKRSPFHAKGGVKREGDAPQ